MGGWPGGCGGVAWGVGVGGMWPCVGPLWDRPAKEKKIALRDLENLTNLEHFFFLGKVVKVPVTTSYLIPSNISNGRVDGKSSGG